MGTPTGLPSFSLRVSLTADHLWGEGAKDQWWTSADTPPHPFLKNIEISIVSLFLCQDLAALPWAPVCCTHPSSTHSSTCTHRQHPPWTWRPPVLCPSPGSLKHQDHSLLLLLPGLISCPQSFTGLPACYTWSPSIAWSFESHGKAAPEKGPCKSLTWFCLCW